MEHSHSAVVEWIQSFPIAAAKECGSMSDLQSGYILREILMNIFGQETPDSLAESQDALLDLIRATQSFFLLYLKREISAYPISYKGVSSGDTEAINSYVQLLFLAQVECSRSEEFLPQILNLSEHAKAYVAQVVESLREDSRLVYVDDFFGNEASELREHLIAERELNRDLADKFKVKSAQEGCADEIKDLALRLESVEQEKLDLELKLALIMGELESSNHTKDSLESELETLKQKELAGEEVNRSIQIQKQQIEILENKISNNDTSLQQSIEDLRRENEELKRKLTEKENHLTELQGETEIREKELGQFVMTGGALGGELRDKVIKTLQEQLTLREEELEFFRSRDFESQEEQRKGERLLVSAIHAIALKYHEEMVDNFGKPPTTEEFSNTNKSTPEPHSSIEA